MSSSIIRKNNKNSVLVRKNLETYYINKYYNLFMNNFKFGDELDYQQKDFILRQFWSNGTIACFKLKGTEGSSAHPQGLLVFCPYAPNGWNIYDFPTSVNLINTKGVKFIPTTAQELDKDVVIGWAQRNKKSVYQFVKTKIDLILDVEMVIRCNLQTHKMPWLFTSTPEMEKKMKVIAENLRSDDPELFVSGDEAEMMKALVSGAPFILDKLYNYKSALENEIREYLGLDSLGINEKKEHLITSEVEVNDDIVESSENCFLDCIKEFFERIQKVFGIEIPVEMNKDEDDYEKDEESAGEVNMEDDENE